MILPCWLIYRDTLCLFVRSAIQAREVFPATLRILATGKLFRAAHFSFISFFIFFQAATASRTRPDRRTKSVHVEIERTQLTLSETRTDPTDFVGDHGLVESGTVRPV